MDIGQWWQNILTNNELRKIRAAQAAQIKGMELASGQNQQVLDMYRKMYGDIHSELESSGGAGGGLPEQYNEMVNLFRQGGQFGEGGRAEVRRGAQQGLASGQIALGQTGMSSGTNVAGLRARVAADEALGRKKIEDERIGLLGGALGQAGAATLSAREIAQRKGLQLIQTLGQLQPGFVKY